jgi:MFS family permease
MGARSSALVGLLAAQLLIVIDVSIVNVLPTIASHLRIQPADPIWVVNAYAVTFGGFLLLGGRAGDVFGSTRIFVAGLLVFSVASAAGGLATSAMWLDLARAAQGLGAAAIAPSVLAIIADSSPPLDRVTRQPIRLTSSLIGTPRTKSSRHSPARNSTSSKTSLLT